MARRESSPMRAARFLRAISDDLQPLRGTRIFPAVIKDHLEKTGHIDAGYTRWLLGLLDHLKTIGVLGSNPKVLDLGCGTGELVVRLNMLGVQATGFDLHRPHIGFARILAQDNGVNPGVFELGDGGALPFETGQFDLVLSLSMLEHVSDETAAALLPELRRICKGAVYVLVPNRLKITDDHTGLHFVPWLPRRLARLYVALRGAHYRYGISRSGEWDVYFRWPAQVERLLRSHGFDAQYVADEAIYPSLEQCPVIRGIGGGIRIAGRRLPVAIPLPVALLTRWGVPLQWFYPYLNLLARPTQARLSQA